VTDQRPRSRHSLPIKAEAFVVWLNGHQLELARPRDAERWLIDVRAKDDPVELVNGNVRAVLGPPRLVHSTSWRREHGALILSFVVMVDSPRVVDLCSDVIRRSKPARSGATPAPTEISPDQVLEHGLRHLAWLASDDPVVSSTLSVQWHRALATFIHGSRGPRSRSSAGWGRLTPRELEVVYLAVEGLSNPDIGRRLYMSRGTVKTHLSHVFAKVGISNRTELATLVAARLSSRSGSAGRASGWRTQRLPRTTRHEGATE
jgi:DNA-binding CsgD family transcriptional regulator